VIEDIKCTLSLLTNNQNLAFVWEFGGEGKGKLWRVGNMGENGKIFHIFLKESF
jgi:hypothetical protein